MPGNYTSPTRMANQVLTAAQYNADHAVHHLNAIPSGIDDYSTDVTEMQTTVDPGEVGTESLPTNLAGELARLRFAIKEMKQTAQWYETVAGILPIVRDVDATQTVLTSASGKTATRSLTVAADTLIAGRIVMVDLFGTNDWTNPADMDFEFQFGGVAQYLKNVSNPVATSDEPWRFRAWTFFAGTNAVKHAGVFQYSQGAGSTILTETFYAAQTVTLSSSQDAEFFVTVNTGSTTHRTEMSEMLLRTH